MKDDVLERAFALLRESGNPEEPDAELEEKLRQRQRVKSSKSPILRRLFARALFLGAISGVAYASGGFDWVRSLFYTVEFGDQRLVGEIEGNGKHTYHFATDDRGRATVTIERHSLSDGSTRTRLGLDRQTPWGLEEEREEHIRSPYASNASPFTSVPKERLSQATRIYRGQLEHSEVLELYVLPLESSAASQLLCFQPNSKEASLRVLHEFPFNLLRDEARIELKEIGDGSIQMSYDDGRGNVFELSWQPFHRNTAPPELQLETIDGTIRLRAIEESKE